MKKLLITFFTTIVIVIFNVSNINAYYEGYTISTKFIENYQSDYFKINNSNFSVYKTKNFDTKYENTLNDKDINTRPELSTSQYKEFFIKYEEVKTANGLIVFVKTGQNTVISGYQITNPEQTEIFFNDTSRINTNSLIGYYVPFDTLTDDFMLRVYNFIEINEILLVDIREENESIEPEPEPEPIIKEVQEIKVKATHNKVDLIWKLPEEREDLAHVNIYRGEVKEVARRSFLTNVASANDTELTKIFETNGTYFNDLTVQENTEYEYKLTVQKTDGTETEGVTTRVRTAAAPTPAIDDLTITKPDDQNYLVTWSNTEGEAIIKVDDQEYARVPAADQQYLIPIEDVPLDMFKNPKIEVIIVGLDGKETKPTKPIISGDGFNNIKLPFNVLELIKVSFEILKLLAPFILLGLAIMFTPKIIRLIREVIDKKRG